MVGQQYGDDDARRDSGYALYYMGINIGSLIAYLVTGYLQENWGWDYAFGAAAIGMAIGLIQYYFTNSSLASDSTPAFSQKRDLRLSSAITIPIAILNNAICR